jgi:hypothetical protein
MEPATGLAILGSAVGGAKVVEKILGPTAEYLGGGLRAWTERRVQNVAAIFHKAQAKLGSDIDREGSVPPRVLKEVLDEGSFCDDELTAEYFGGILASSRTPNGRDDRGATYLRLTSELSTYQIRFHYICYLWWREFYVGSQLCPTFSEDIHKMWMFLPYPFLIPAMDFSETEPPMDILLHCTSGLSRAELLEIAAWGRPEHVSAFGKPRHWNEVTVPGMAVCPTQFGIDYFLWAVGAGSVNRSEFLLPDLKLPKLPEIKFSGSPVKLLDEKKI